MTTIHRLESPKPQDHSVGGVLITFDSGRQKVVSWRSSTPITEIQLHAKKSTEAVISSLLEVDASKDLNDTNWVSVVSAMEKHIRDWNASLARMCST